MEINLYILFNSKIHHILEINFFFFFLISDSAIFCGKWLNKVIGLRPYYYYFIIRSINLFKNIFLKLLNCSAFTMTTFINLSLYNILF